MGILKRLFLFCLLLAGLNATINAAPSQDDRAQVSQVFFDVQPAAIAILYDAPTDLQTAEHSFWDIGLQQNTTTNSSGDECLDAAVCLKTGFSLNLNFGICNKDGSADSPGRQQRVNSDQIFVLPQATKDGNEGGNSANSAIWTATDHDDGAQHFYFFLSNTTCAVQTTSAQQPDYQLRC